VQVAARFLEVLLMTLGGLWQGVRQDFNLLEILLIAAGVWAWKRGWLPRLRLRLPSAIVLVLGTIALRLALLPVLHAPVPVVSDEFSHLLLADTLSHGRAANPTHPFWQHFETLHVIQQPHYGSDYFPGQAAVLAAGRAVIGSAWSAVLFECAVFLSALYWMLLGWMPRRWALAGVALAALRFGIGSYWVNAYHGGFLPAIGGALIAGAFPRLYTDQNRPLPLVAAHSAAPMSRDHRKRSNRHVSHSFAHGTIFGLGLAILETTRPFEGALFAIPFVAMLIWKLRWQIWKLAIPALAIAGAAAILMGAYFERVTGSPFVTSYQVNQKAYGWPMGLAWTPPPKIEFRNIELRRYYDYEVGEHEKVDGPVDFVEYLTFRIQEYWRFFIGPALTIPLIMLARVWRRQRLLLLGMAGALFAILLEGAASPHYLAPATAVIVAIVIECCRHLHAKRIPMIPLAAAAMTIVLALRIGAQNLNLPYTQELNYQSWCCKQQGNMNKQRITRALESTAGEHLVFVKTKSSEFNLLQWIYNAADIDASRIVWARDLGGEQNARLAAYYRDRQVWMVDPNVEPAALLKYSANEVGVGDHRAAKPDELLRADHSQVRVGVDQANPKH
jgi:hypothetical protein